MTCGNPEGLPVAEGDGRKAWTLTVTFCLMIAAWTKLLDIAA